MQGIKSENVVIWGSLIVMKIRTDKAIMYFWDMESDMPRRVVFGDPSELYDFFLEQSKILHERLRKLNKTYSDREDLESAIENTREGFEIDNKHGAFGEKQVIEFSYRILKNTKRKL